MAPRTCRKPPTVSYSLMGRARHRSQRHTRWIYPPLRDSSLALQRRRLLRRDGTLQEHHLHRRRRRAVGHHRTQRRWQASIFKLITGELEPTVGSVARKPDSARPARPAPRIRGATTVWDAGAAAWREVIALEKRIAEQAIEWVSSATASPKNSSNGSGMPRSASRPRRLHLSRSGRRGASGLGFDAEESKRGSVSSLSGGERGRGGLAAQLISPADLLLLDKPTNHLDLDTTTWLQEWLQTRQNGHRHVHDRAFLDAICTHILHVEGRRASGTGATAASSFRTAEQQVSHERELEKRTRIRSNT